jgi:hypothetical protein
MVCSSVRSQRLILEECLKYVIFNHVQVLSFLTLNFQVDCPEKGLWKTATFTGRYSKQASGHDVPGRERTELA